MNDVLQVNMLCLLFTTSPSFFQTHIKCTENMWLHFEHLLLKNKLRTIVILCRRWTELHSLGPYIKQASRLRVKKPWNGVWMNPSVHEVCCPQESLPARTDEIEVSQMSLESTPSKTRGKTLSRFTKSEVTKDFWKKERGWPQWMPTETVWRDRSGILAELWDPDPSAGLLTHLYAQCMLPQTTTPSATDQRPLCWRCFPHSFQSQQVISDSR